MCEPVTPMMAFSMAFGALTTGASYYAERENAEAMTEYQNEMYRQGTKNAQEAYRFNTAQELTRMMQEEESYADQSLQTSLKRRRAFGTALASSTAIGTNLDSLQEDFLRQEADEQHRISRERDWMRQQSRANMRGYQAQAKDRIAAYTPAPVSQPSLAGAIAGLGTRALNSYATYGQGAGKRK